MQGFGVFSLINDLEHVELRVSVNRSKPYVLCKVAAANEVGCPPLAAVGIHKVRQEVSQLCWLANC
jgi:hypothetical protein